MSDLSSDQKKEYARMLFMGDQLTQKEIAARVGTSEKRISLWAAEGGWEELRLGMAGTNDEQLAYLNRILKKKLKEAQAAQDDDDPETNPDTDGIIKLTKAINYLSNKTGTAAMYETGMQFLIFLQRESCELAKEIAPLFDAFIKENLQKSGYGKSKG